MKRALSALGFRALSTCFSSLYRSSCEGASLLVNHTLLSWASDTAPPITFELPVTEQQIKVMRRGMRRVVGPDGTAQLSRLPGWDFMGKTGTAQNPHGPDHAWFVGIGGPWGGEPEIVAVLLLEHGEQSGRGALEEGDRAL